MASDVPPAPATEPGQAPPASWRPPSLPFVPAALPPLPPIPDATIAVRARTHKGSVTQADGNKRDSRHAELASNEILEWKGDAALHWLISTHLSAVLPTATSGELSDLRSRLTSNRTFSHLAWHYGLTSALFTRKNQLSDNSTAEEQQRTAANALEAHIGGLIDAHQGDVRPVSDYLRQLLLPAVFPAFLHIKRSLENASNPDASGPPNKRPRLETGDAVLDAENRTSSGRRAVTRFRHHQWIDEFTENRRWTATLEIGGQVVGVGAAGKIAAARDVALEAYLDKISNATSSPA
ncbi:hypothetical protein BMF94_0250 [Rhodotorula taiwanensis]|uniref:RNase III domain-containing protein n=1 Tax=Rhodotorula taiwanensis TaxID=741276 RepID=A0A2S5BIQ6_9BASI|nr:hypothetical protein BMF94_0250 [Rhodotorula taiwanensis]